MLIEPVPEIETFGISEEDWSDSPEAVADWLEWYVSLEPLEITPEEETEWQAWREKSKRYGIAKTNERIEGLFE